MTLDQLRIFVAVAEREHVTRAAQTLHLTQSAVSAAIATLEERHGTRLFHRVGRGIALTEAGRAFLPEARAVLARAEAATAVLADLSGLARGNLRIAASQTVGGYWLPVRLARFRAAHPGIDLQVTIANTHDVATAVAEGAADLGVVEGAVDDPALAAWQVGEDRMRIVQAPPADTRALADARWVMREAGSGTRAVLETALRQHGLDPAMLEITLELPSNEAVRSAVAAGAGVTGLSSLVVEAMIDAGRLVALPIELPPRPFLALRHKERYRSRAADAFTAMLDEVAISRRA
ncbi:MAG TPA: LysR family transcriptional regulator [Sphingomonas sp.]|nr:LysR family transcriptional regulator [Sphingomonas sp.]